MAKLCCFLHPAYSSDETQTLEDRCPTCQRKYGFPILDSPTQVDDYHVTAPLDRGFYSVAYVVETKPFKRRKVLKLAFKSTYDYFKKNFEEECQTHARLAEGSQHIVGIDNMKLNVDVVFGGESHTCHLAELDFVDGATLRSILDSTDRLRAKSIAQIAIDLFSILQELENKGERHNDLQPANLIVQQLSSENRRANAEDESIRVVAIDLNSASDQSRSDPKSQRLGDLHWVVTYLRRLVSRLVSNPDETSDLEYRLASTLEERAAVLAPDTLGQRTPSFEECIEDIRSAIRQVSSPWKDPPQLRRFNDAYNAQTLAAWFVPYLIVDPDEKWLASISTPGPQVVVGMRGCGKTMLLRAMQFHARATQTGSTDTSAVLDRLRNDKFIGIYASSTRLLDTVGSKAQTLNAPYVRLLVQYALEGLRAVRHLREIAAGQVIASYHQEIGRVVASFIKGGEGARDAVSDYQLERYLLEVMVKVSRGESGLDFVGHPSSAFPRLAEAICGASPIWSDATVFYLLDDVSTRYLEREGIVELMSALLFSDPKCAFKLTTEAQTLEMILRSPGQIERAREGRDYQVFDLGAEVNGLIRSSKGYTFVERVLQQRAQYYAHHPHQVSPKQLLGDAPLESLAEWISTTGKTSNERKRTYHGITALTGVCVGDIGDVISLYELILRRSKNEATPISTQIQSECYQDYCSRRLYDLNRRGGWLKDHAFAFAKASHALLMKSQKDFQEKPTTKKRLRQYLKLYVRLTSGNTEEQFKKLRDLIDAGVFVLDGGAHRSKTRDTDPFQQFKLTYRKLYGLSNFIGLAERDRFELSGEDLIEWLDNPATGDQVLVRNLAGEDELEEVAALEERLSASESTSGNAIEESRQPASTGGQLTLGFSSEESLSEDAPLDATDGVGLLIKEKTPVATKEDLSVLQRAGIKSVILGLGFEERTAASVVALRHAVVPTSALLIRYAEQGRAKQIKRNLWKSLTSTLEVDYGEIGTRELELPDGPVLIDVTGLAKPVIFHAVRTALRRDGVVWICRTRAAQYYPLDEDIDRVLQADKNWESAQLLEELSKILTGEQGPYQIDPMLKSDADESRRRILCAFSSPKHERLLKLLDERTYEAILVVTHNDGSPRGKMARIAADLAARNYSGADVCEYGSDDLQGILRRLVEHYQRWYTEQGYNFELGLTGSKLQAVACAAISSTFKISQCWYVRPGGFDAQRFTEGVGDTTIFQVKAMPSS